MKDWQIYFWLIEHQGLLRAGLIGGWVIMAGLLAALLICQTEERKMKKGLGILLLITVLPLLGGCMANNSRTTTYYDQDGRPVRAVQEKTTDDAANYDANARVAEAEASIVEKVIAAPCPLEPVAQAWCQSGKMNSINTLVLRPHRTIARGPSLVDLGMRTVDAAGGAVPWLFGIFAVDKLGDSVGGNNYVQADTVTDSFNKPEMHITGSSQSSMVLDSSRPTTTTTGVMQ